MGVEPEDTLKTKKALSDLGHYKIKSGLESFGITDFVDNEMFDGIKSFQKDNELEVDGIMHPGGPTERKINQSLMNKKHFGDPKQDKGLNRAQWRRERLEALRIKKPDTNKFDNPFDHKGFNFNEAAERPKTKPTTLFDGDEIKKEDQETRIKNEPLKPATQLQENKDELTLNPPQTMSRKTDDYNFSFDMNEVLFFESRNREKLYHLEGYIPKDDYGQPMKGSGVTLAGGVDIGQMNINEFDSLAKIAKFDEETTKNLRSLVGLQDEEAFKKLQELGPITISDAQARRFTYQKYDDIQLELKNTYNKFVNRLGLPNGRQFQDLSVEERTALMSIGAHEGAGKPWPILMKAFYRSDYDGVINELNNFYAERIKQGKYTPEGWVNRRKLEGNYLKKHYEQSKTK